VPHQFEILEHAADVGFRAFGESLPELFVNAALALQSIALDTSNVEPHQEYELTANGEEYESLLINWLNEIVYYLDGEHVAMSRFDVQELTHASIRAKAWGEPRDRERHPARIVVKAATYHQLRIEQSNGCWRAEVYLDI